MVKTQNLRMSFSPWVIFSLVALVLLGCGGGGSSSGSSKPPVQPPADSVEQELNALAKDISMANGGRAAILYVETPDKVWQVVAGKADVASGVDAKIEDRVEIGSVSKVFLAVTILRLVEQGTLSLEDPLTQWFELSELDALTSGNGSGLVVRHLLGHASGMGDYLNFATDETVLQTYGLTGHEVYTPQGLIDKTIDLTSNPVEYIFPFFSLQDVDGKSYPDYDSIPQSAYSNTGYVMLGLIAEAVTGLRYEDLIQQQILDPLDLDDTLFGTNGEKATLTGYALGLSVSGEEPVRSSPSLTWSAGQIISTTENLAQFFSVAISGGLFDQQKTLELWKNDYYKPLFKLFPYGLGLEKRDITGVGTVYGHDGQVLGAVALIAHDPTTGNTYTVAVNNSQYVSPDKDAEKGIWDLVLNIQQVLAKSS